MDGKITKLDGLSIVFCFDKNVCEMYILLLYEILSQILKYTEETKILENEMNLTNIVKIVKRTKQLTNPKKRLFKRIGDSRNKFKCP